MTVEGEAILTTALPPPFQLVARGKVRDLYKISGNDRQLFFVATDRISAFDVVLDSAIPKKGTILTAISQFWFDELKCSNHLITADISKMPEAAQKHSAILEGRTMLVRNLKMLPVEAIVRGYITGSAWNEYKRSGTVHGATMPKDLRESQEFTEPIFTPSTKAEQGDKDENISYEQFESIVGRSIAERVRSLALDLYKQARHYAREHGIIIADTKFEFAYDEEKDEIVLADEVLTPDSSRFWPLQSYEVGKPQPSFDKQFVRDWLIDNNKKGVENIALPDEIVQKTAEKYAHVYEMLRGST